MASTQDIIIIGGGPTGISCAIEASKSNLSSLIIEKGVLVNSIYNFPANMTFFSTSRRLEIGNIPFISHGEKPTRREALEYYRRLQQAYQIQIKLYEPAIAIHTLPNGQYEVVTEKGKYSARSIIIATGFYDTPRYLNIPGEELPKVKHYYDDAHPYLGQQVLVI